MGKICLIGSREAAELLGMSRSSFSRAINRKKVIPAVKIPGSTGSYLFDKSDIEALAKGKSDV